MRKICLLICAVILVIPLVFGYKATVTEAATNPAELTPITLSDFGVADGKYASLEAANVPGYSAANLNGTLFSAKLTATAKDGNSIFYYGATNTASGTGLAVRVYDQSIYISDLEGKLTGTVGTSHDIKASDFGETTWKGTEFLLQIATEYVGNDIKFTVYVNNVLCKVNLGAQAGADSWVATNAVARGNFGTYVSVSIWSNGFDWIRSYKEVKADELIVVDPYRKEELKNEQGFWRDSLNNIGMIGKAFAGWWTSTNYDNWQEAFDDEMNTGSAYAKYVDKKLLTVKAQVADSAKTENAKDMRFVTTVESLNYKEVGFYITINGETRRKASSTVYTSISANGETLYAEDSLGLFSEESAYFATFTITNIPEEKHDSEITVQPFWVTLDGTEVVVKPEVKTVRQYSGALAVPDFLVEVESGREPVVLQLTDPQIIDASQQRTPSRLNDGEDEYWGADKAEVRCYSYLRETIQNTNPDLILITGDIIYGEFDDNGTALQTFIEFMESFEIPWAPVFGNHDNESTKGVDWQCQQFENAQWCMFKQRELTGNGNYTVGIKQDGELKRVFFMLDSNGCGGASSQSLANGHTVTSTGFGADQINWYTETAESIKEQSPETKFTFAFHIQLAVFADAYAKYGFNNSTTQTNPINIYTHADREEGDFGYLGRNLKSAWDTNYAVWNGLKALGVDSILVGHEHCNVASVVYEGVRLQFGQKISTYDRANFINSDGTIVGAYRGDADGSRTALMGGVVMPLDAEDATIKAPYVYLCGGLDWETLGKDEAEDTISVDGLQYNGTDLYSDSNITVTKTTIGGANAYKCEAVAQGKVYINTNLLKNKSTFTFSIYVPEGTTIFSGFPHGEFAIRVKPTEPATADGASNGYIVFTSDTTTENALYLTQGQWQTFTIDISNLGTSCTEWSFVLFAGNTYYLKDIAIR